MRGLRAARPLAARQYVASYPVEIVRHTRRGYRDNMYTVQLYNHLSGRALTTKLGDVTPRTLRLYADPHLGLPPVALFVNEPDAESRENTQLVFPVVDSRRTPLGTVAYGYLQTTRAVRAGEPLLACYDTHKDQTSYPRRYRTSCNQ